MKSLLIIGAGGHGTVVEEIAKSTMEYEKIDFLDDNSDKAIGKIESMSNFVTEYDDLVCSIGNNKFRKSVLEKAEKFGFNIPTIVHPTAYVSCSARIGKGSIIEPKSIVNSNSVIGQGCIISVGAIVDHNVEVKNYAHVNAGVVCLTGTVVEEFTKISR